MLGRHSVGLRGVSGCLVGEAVPGGSVGEDGWRPDVGCMVDEAVAGGLVELEDELCTDVREEAR